MHLMHFIHNIVYSWQTLKITADALLRALITNFQEVAQCNIGAVCMVQMRIYYNKTEDEVC